MALNVQHFYHQPSGTLSYVLSDSQTSVAAIVDPVLGFSVVSGRTDPAPAVAIADYVHSNDLSVAWILETHAHADHLSAAQFLKTAVGGKVAVGAGIKSVQSHFSAVFNTEPKARTQQHDFDHLFIDNETFDLGNLLVRVLHTPGHTDDSVAYRIDSAVFVGDTVFMTDIGTARCDFPGGDAGKLYDSIQRLFSLPEETQLYLCHDYPPEGRSLRFQVSVAEQKANNVHVADGIEREDFIAMRVQRDAGLPLPKLLLPSLQVNIRAGFLPESEDNGTAYIKIPLDVL